ncbi:hypothetical protein H4219_000699 [Mycoemilia scoparia]|uniref:Nudix hydrolase domain-containing protein n=1 Tax=Mycoemilia scoparia TaxID=417184 RepID=A0A9W8A8K0_9FUNG|nr:hypothetical protein H4219_000699 [Mycoemilia scoparia]
MFLLLKRSDKVRTFKHSWAAVSGTLDASDDGDHFECALREISEETGFHRDQLLLVNKGEAQHIKHSSTGNTFTVYPFLFQLKNVDQISKTLRMDWEHEELLWVPEDQVMDFMTSNLTVPDLISTWLRVYFPKPIRNYVYDIQNDCINGAQYLSIKAVKAMRDLCEPYVLGQLFGEMVYNHDTSLDPKYLKEVIIALVLKLCHLRPPMRVPITNALYEVFDNALKESNGELRPQSIQKAANIWIEKQNDAFSMLRREFIKTVKCKFASFYANLPDDQKEGVALCIHVFTISYSSAVRACLNELIDWGRQHRLDSITITCTESRPKNEGAKLVADLSKESEQISQTSVNYEIIADAAAGIRMEEVVSDKSDKNSKATMPIAIVGSDRVVPETKQFVNKIGTASFLACANLFNIPTFVTCLASKIALKSNSKSEGDECFCEPDHDGSELYSSYPRDVQDLCKSGKIKVYNQYFELVPSSIVTKVNPTFVKENGSFCAQNLDSNSNSFPRTLEAIQAYLGYKGV